MEILEYCDHVVENPRVVSIKDRGHYYASDASIEIEDEFGEKQVIGGCLRKQYYRIKGERVVAEFDPAGSRVTGYGNAIHDFEVNRMKMAGIVEASEVAFFDDVYNVSGRVDVFIRNPNSKTTPKQLCGVELKTVGGVYTIKGAIRPTQQGIFRPKESHILQTMKYAEYYDRYSSEPMTWYIVYYDRSGGATAQHTLILTKDGVSINGTIINWTPSMINTRWERLSRYVDEGQLPPKDYALTYSAKKIRQMVDRCQLTKGELQAIRSGKPIHKGDSECKWCPYKVSCWGEEASQIGG